MLALETVVITPEMASFLEKEDVTRDLMKFVSRFPKDSPTEPDYDMFSPSAAAAERCAIPVDESDTEEFEATKTSYRVMVSASYYYNSELF